MRLAVSGQAQRRPSFDGDKWDGVWEGGNNLVSVRHIHTYEKEKNSCTAAPPRPSEGWPGYLFVSSLPPSACPFTGIRLPPNGNLQPLVRTGRSSTCPQVSDPGTSASVILRLRPPLVDGRRSEVVGVHRALHVREDGDAAHRGGYAGGRRPSFR